MGSIGRVLETIFFQVKDMVLLLIVVFLIDGLRLDKEQIILPIQIMVLIGLVLENLIYQVVEEVLLGMEHYGLQVVLEQIMFSIRVMV